MARGERSSAQEHITGVLRHNADSAPQAPLCDATHVLVVDQHCALTHVVEPKEEAGDCRLASPSRSDNCGGGAGRRHKRQVAQAPGLLRRVCVGGRGGVEP